MKTMKRALTLIMAVMMVAAMAACGNKPAASNGDETTGDGSLKRVQDAGKLIASICPASCGRTYRKCFCRRFRIICFADGRNSLPVGQNGLYLLFIV